MDQEKQKNMLQNIPYIQFNGIVIDRIGMEESVLYVDMRHELENPYGMAHGGLLFTLVDTAGGSVVGMILQSRSVSYPRRHLITRNLIN